MKEKYLYPKEMFDVSANGQYCGVLVPSHVMKKFMKLSNKWSIEIQQLLNEHKDELLVSDWTGVFPKDDEGKILGSQIVRYSNGNEYNTVEQRISLFKPMQPKHEDVYICTREVAETIAQEIYNERSTNENTKHYD